MQLGRFDEADRLYRQLVQQFPKHADADLWKVRRVVALHAQKKYRETIAALGPLVAQLRSPDNTYWCWGYSFPWQTRTFLVPTGAPNLVCTSFVASALLNAYDQSRDQRCLSMAVSAAE